MKFMKKLICITLTGILFISFTSCAVIKKTISPDMIPQIGTFKELGYKNIRQFKATVSTANDYISNQGLKHIGIIKAPYFTTYISGIEIPMYATAIYSGYNDAGVLHCFGTAEVELDQFPLNLKITAPIKTADTTVLPKRNISLKAEDKTISAQISEYGFYTFIIDFPDQEYTCTIQIRQPSDETAEIQEYINQYGKENVTVLEAGQHQIDYLILNNNSVLYLKRGAYITATHIHDINNTEDDVQKKDNRYNGRNAVLNANNFENITIAGHGIIDMSMLDLHERNGLTFYQGKNLTIKDITLINSGNWNMYLYRVNNAVIDNVTILGSRINSDGINICNSTNIAVSNCFIRTGDDCYSAKTLGAGTSAPTENITFTNNIAWASKARCFGITGEVNFDIRNVTFENSTVITRDGTWDNDRIGSLVIIVEEGTGNIENITFRNINIAYDNGRAINLSVKNSERNHLSINQITFEDITYLSEMSSQLKATNETNNIHTTIKNVTANGNPITVDNIDKYFIKDLSTCTIHILEN